MNAPSRHRALIVEDSRVQGEALRALLEEAGLTVSWATTGERAVEELEAAAFDIMLSDIVLPGIDGYEVCRRAKARRPEMPVVLLTSLGDPLDVVRGLDAGADNFLRKPYNPVQLVERVRTILHGAELRRAGTHMGLEVFFRNRRFMITAERQQILDLLVSTFEELIDTNAELRDRGGELAEARDALAAQLAETETERERLRGVLDAVPLGITVFDGEGRVVQASSAIARVLGRPLADILGRRVGEVAPLFRPDGAPIPPEERPAFRALAGIDAEMGGAFDTLVERGDGSRMPVVAKARPIRDDAGRIVGGVSVYSELGELADHDPVTNLPTQRLFADRVFQCIAVSAGGDRRAAVVAVTILHPERLRQRLGNAYAEFLRAVAGRLLATPGAQFLGDRSGAVHSAGRIGDAEFALGLRGLRGEIDALRAAQHVAEALRRPFAADGREIQIQVSVGVALEAAGDSSTDLISGALMAARRGAEHDGGRVELHEAGRNAIVVEQIELEEELRAAIAADALSVYYQPVLEVGGGAPVGAEALVRWQHPSQGLLGAGRFVPLAEEAGLIAPLSWRVLEAACRQAAAWRRDLPGASDFSLSVNIVAAQLAEHDLVGRVSRILEGSGLPADALLLELTESAVFDAPWAADHLRALKALGVRLAIDDFGTGYSSLLQLRRFPVDEVKIDRSFIAGMVSEADDAAIVTSVVQLGRALGLGVVAEGVETLDQLMRLRGLGCDLAQGYHWSPALPPPEFEEWWRGRVTSRAADLLATGAAGGEGAPDATGRLRARMVEELQRSLGVLLRSAGSAAGVPLGDELLARAEQVLRDARGLQARLELLAHLDAGRPASQELLERL